MDKERCERYGYLWVTAENKCRNPRDMRSVYLETDTRNTPEDAFMALMDEMSHHANAPSDPRPIFYPWNFHADWETTGEAPVYDYATGMQMARDGKRPGFGAGAGNLYMEGHIEKKPDGKYVAYGEYLPSDTYL